MKLIETDPAFQATLARIGVVSGLDVEAVYTLWQAYEHDCTDQSAILLEFVLCHKDDLGGNYEALAAALEEPEATPEAAAVTGETARGAYSDTPHKTIEELVAMARQRVADGEQPYQVRQDIVNGYSLGFGSANDSLVQAACEEAHAAKSPAPATPRKWQADASNPPGPIQVTRFNKAFGHLRSEHNTRREKWGVIGVNEHDNCMVSLFGANRREDVTAVEVEIGTRFDYTVSKANVNQIISAIEASLPELAKNRPCDDKRKTVEQDAQERAEMRVIEEQREAKDRERRSLVAAKVLELRAQYPWTTPAGEMRGGPRAAANCKIELSKLWPFVRWSVRSDHNSMRVGWTDGPTTKQVEEIIHKYKDGYFDGQTDCHEYDGSILGSAIDEVLGWVAYQSVDRSYGEPHMSMKVQNEVAGWIVALEGIEAGGRELWDVSIPRFENGNRFGATSAARNVLDATELPAGARVVGVEWNNNVEGGLNVPENWYKLVLEVPTAAAIPVPAQAGSGALGTVARNLEHDGVEIAFAEKPSDGLRLRLKAAGFRITRRPPWRWYRKYSVMAWKAACELAGVNGEEVASTGSRVEANGDGAAGYVEAQENAFCDAQAAACGA